MSADRATLALRLAAFAAAMGVKAGTFGREDVASLRAQAARYVARCPDHDRPLPRAVDAFCDRIEQSFAERDADIRLTAATDITRFIELANMPVPPGLNRSDING